MRFVGLFVFALVPYAGLAQWTVQQSPTTSALRSVHTVTERVAWASGAGGTVVRTTDGGVTWQPCSIPGGAERLDLVGIQASDENVAVVISTGEGNQSRLYKTADGCQTWKLTFTNPDSDGSFKGIHRMTDKQLYLLGDPVEGKFSVFYSGDSGDTWNSTDDPGLNSEKGEHAFSAGNGSLISVGPFLYFGTRSASGLHLYHTFPHCASGEPGAGGCPIAWLKTDVPLQPSDNKAAEFSLAARTQVNMRDGSVQTVLVAVASLPTGSAATSRDDGQTWKAAAVPPDGGALALAYQSSTRSWIAVGTDITYLSGDDGQKWRGIASAPAEPKDVGLRWNALSLPFVVGDGGKIGKLDPALSQATAGHAR